MTQRPEPDPFSLIEIPNWNPWWEDESAIPLRSFPRADLYWRVKNTLENDLVLIPGPPVTGTNTTLKQIVRALILGAKYEDERVQTLFRDDSIGNIGADGCLPLQVCYTKCSDPLAHLVEDYVNEARKNYHAKAATTGKLDFYLVLEDIHHLDSWREQLIETHTKLAEELPGNWTVVASVPVARLAHETDYDGVDAVEVDRPHHTQKFRDTLFSHAPGLRESIRPVNAEETPIDRARTVLRDAAVGDVDANALATEFESLREQIRDNCSAEELTSLIEQYLTVGGFEPAIGNLYDHSDEDPSARELNLHASAVSSHIQNGFETTLYQDIPRLAKTESAVPRIENPEELHAMIAFLARREFDETTYIGLGEFLSCDPRTIRQKYVPILEDLHIGERATRYDLDRNRTLRFYLRSPGYVTAFKERRPTDDDRADRLRITLADHLRRLLANFGSDELLQYWRDEDHLVDYVIDVDGYPVSFVSTFADEIGGTAAGLDAFDATLKEPNNGGETDGGINQPNVEISITDMDGDIVVQEIDQRRLRLHLPHWLLLTIC